MVYPAYFWSSSFLATVTQIDSVKHNVPFVCVCVCVCECFQKDCDVMDACSHRIFLEPVDPGVFRPEPLRPFWFTILWKTNTALLIDRPTSVFYHTFDNPALASPHIWTWVSRRMEAFKMDLSEEGGDTDVSYVWRLFLHPHWQPWLILWGWNRKNTWIFFAQTSHSYSRMSSSCAGGHRLEVKCSL